jgi:hypothetical protein
VQGVTGPAGSDGISSVTATLTTGSPVLVPAVGGTVALSVGNSDWIALGQILFLAGIGFFQAAAVATGTVTVTNLGYSSNAAPGTVIPVGSIVTPGAPKGANAPDDTRGQVLLTQKALSGVQGGTFTSGAWRARLLNTIEFDTRSQCVSITGGTGIFRLKGGFTYELTCRAPGYSCNRHMARLRNVTSGGYYYGTSEMSVSSQSESIVPARITLANDADFVLEHRCQTTQATNGFGVAASFAGVTEIYASIEIRQVDA